LVVIYQTIDMSRNTSQLAVIQFIRVVDRLADIRKVSWKIVGDFVKDIVLHHTKNEPYKLEFVMVNKGAGIGIMDIVNDLYIMKYVTHCTTTAFKIETRVNVFADNLNVEFDCIFHDNYYECVLASDQITLSQSGMSLLYYGDTFDSRNMNKGIALLQRLADIQVKKDAVTMVYINLPNSGPIRARNAKIMRRQNVAEQQGYTLVGTVLVIDRSDYMCPICYEKKFNNTVLECSHKFCVDCLSSHMEGIGDCHSKCPLCRQSLVLKLVNKL
jgi:hypothetical protein